MTEVRKSVSFAELLHENMETSTASLPNMEDLDKLSDRLGKFKSSSRLPKPEISPKPAHLVAQLAKHKVPNAQTEQQGKHHFSGAERAEQL